MSFEQEMRAALGSFIVEGGELLEEMESGLLGLELGGAAEETVNAVFRAAHTIKGSAGLFGLEPMVRFTHVLESVLDRLRNHEIEVSPELVGALLPCADHLGRLMSAVADGGELDDPRTAEQGAAALAALQPFLAAAASPGPDGGTSAGESAAGAGDPAGGAGPRHVHLSLRFGVDCLRNGMDPLSFIRFLSTLGEVVDVVTLTDLLPEPDLFDPESSYLDFEVGLLTQESLETVETVFEFVRDDSSITVLGPESSPQEYVTLIRTAEPPLGERIRQVLLANDTLDAATRSALQAVGEDGADGSSPVAAPATAAPGRTRPASASAAEPSSRGEGRQATAGRVPAQPARGKAAPASGQPGAVQAGKPGLVAESRSIRIDAGRLDRLIDAVGELVIAGASAELGAASHRDEGLVAALSEVMRLVEEVRDSALQLRMVPIGTTFSRFQRVVRDVGAALGKDVALLISGGDTEVDKALVEQIGDPLTHLVRNSMDHGIEAADVRAARGKPARGTLRLNAFHDSGSIVIEVSDDGGGIDPERVLARAIERGLVEPGSVLTDSEVAQLIFEPGFSTAEAVSDLSGRGVGLDVVKRNVSALRGTIDVDNRFGEGCTVRIRLPLTLAIIDGFMTGVGGATFVIPLDSVVECVELPAASDSRDCMDLRGEVLPFIRLRSLFSIEGDRPRRENVVVVEYAGMKIGLVVDNLMGEFQTVIKPLGPLFGHVQGIGGSTILGNGEVALIIDVPMLIRHYGDRQAGAALVG